MQINSPPVLLGSTVRIHPNKFAIGSQYPSMLQDSKLFRSPLSNHTSNPERACHNITLRKLTCIIVEIKDGLTPDYWIALQVLSANPISPKFRMEISNQKAIPDTN